MKPDDFTAFLDQNDIEYTLNEQSIILAESPCCGGHRKIYLYREDVQDKPLFGKCMKCDTTWSSRSYLTELGFEHGAVDALHGTTDFRTAELGVQTVMAFDLLKNTPPVKLKPQEKIFDITQYYKVTDMPDSSPAKYAKLRGWTEAQADDILIDIFAQAVVFVCREDGKVVGTQSRFLRPPFPHMKVKSAAGFKKTQHILEFPNDGDILICEGPFTALSAWHYGYHGICTFGSGVSERQIQRIADLADRTGKKVGVAFDLDKAGKKGYRVIRMGMYWRKIPTFRVRPEVGNDLNDSWKAGKGVVLIPEDGDVMIPDLDIPEEGMQ